MSNRTLYVNENKEVIDNPVPSKYFGNFKQDNFYSDIKNFFLKVPWFKEKVNDIYIKPMNENSRQLVILSNFIKNNQGEVYFKTNKFYFEAQVHASKRYQYGNVHRFVYKNMEYDMIIGIVTSYGIVDQTEEIFTAQLQFINNWNSKKSQEIEDICNSEVNVSTFSFYIISFFNNILEFREEKYIKRIIEVYYTHFKNGKLFMTNVLDLLVYLNPKISLIRIPIFTSRFKKMYYKPEILPFLNESEKLSEIYDNSTPYETLVTVNRTLYSQKEQMFEEWVNSLLIEKTLDFKRNKVKINAIKKVKFVNLPQWKNACKNYINIQNIEDEDLVFVRDNNDVYGFSIQEMFDIIEHKDCFNPYTKTLISKEFISRFLDTYYKPQSKSLPNELDTNLASEFGKLSTGDNVNTLLELLNQQLCIYEKKCSVCKDKKWRREIYIESYESVIYFCSSECMARYNKENIF